MVDQDAEAGESKGMRSKPTPATKRMKRRIAAISREIQEIESLLHPDSGGDLSQQYFVLDQKKTHQIRGIVLEFHLAIEDLITSWLKGHLLSQGAVQQRTTQRARGMLATVLYSLLEGPRSLGFDRKLDLAEGLHLISKRLHERLTELNVIRNRCSHNWVLDIPIRKGIKRDQPKRRLVQYKNRDLFALSVIKEFEREYGRIYLKLWLKINA